MFNVGLYIYRTLINAADIFIIMFWWLQQFNLWVNSISFGFWPTSAAGTHPFPAGTRAPAGPGLAPPLDRKRRKVVCRQ